MVTFLVSTSEIESMILDMLRDQFGGCFAMEATNVISAMVNSYNRTESDGIVDAVIESIKKPLVNYSPVDVIAAIFVHLIEEPVDTEVNLATLEYRANDDTIVVRQSRRPVPNPTMRIKEDYHHAQAQGDFFPERLRRAYEELISSGV
ncbi:hypothetical protein D3C78_308740 [compost metagenome]